MIQRWLSVRERMEESTVAVLNSSASTSTFKVDRIIKIGGAAITDKKQFETINEENIQRVVESIKQLFSVDKNKRTILIHGNHIPSYL